MKDKERETEDACGKMRLNTANVTVQSYDLTTRQLGQLGPTDTPLPKERKRSFALQTTPQVGSWHVDDPTAQQRGIVQR